MATGFFGKLPAAGDFVTRGLGHGVRPLLDRWLTLHLADAVRTPETWPDTGLYALIEGQGGTLALAILPSHDSTGRKFPLAACCAQVQTDRAGVENWARALYPTLLDAAKGKHGTDELLGLLNGIAPPALSDDPLRGPLIWADSEPTPPAQSLPILFPGLAQNSAIPRL